MWKTYVFAKLSDMCEQVRQLGMRERPYSTTKSPLWKFPDTKVTSTPKLFGVYADLVRHSYHEEDADDW